MALNTINIEKVEKVTSQEAVKVSDTGSTFMEPGTPPNACMRTQQCVANIPVANNFEEEGCTQSYTMATGHVCLGPHCMMWLVAADAEEMKQSWAALLRQSAGSWNLSVTDPGYHSSTLLCVKRTSLTICCIWNHIIAMRVPLKILKYSCNHDSLENLYIRSQSIAHLYIGPDYVVAADLKVLVYDGQVDAVKAVLLGWGPVRPVPLGAAE